MIQRTHIEPLGYKYVYPPQYHDISFCIDELPRHYICLDKQLKNFIGLLLKHLKNIPKNIVLDKPSLTRYLNDAIKKVCE